MTDHTYHSGHKHSRTPGWEARKTIPRQVDCGQLGQIRQQSFLQGKKSVREREENQGCVGKEEDGKRRKEGRELQ